MFADHTKDGVFMSTYRRPRTDEAREHANAYRREYRKRNPERVKKWRADYIMRTAARLAAAQIGSDGGQDHGTKGGED